MGMRKHYRGDVSIPIEEWENREGRRSNPTSTAAAAPAAAPATTSRGRDAERMNPPNAPIQMSSAPPNPTPPAAAAAAAASASWCGIMAAQIAKLLFFFHLVAFVILVVFLLVHGFRHRSRTFKAVHWFVPLLTSIAESAFAALLILLLTLRWPRLALKNSLWLSPLLIFGLAFLLLGIGTSQGLAVAVLALILALAEALYACWIVPRLPHAYEVLSASISAAQVPPSTAVYASLTVLAGAAYSAFWTLGVGGVAADDDSRFGPLYVVVLLLNLAWTMQVIKYLTHAAVARLAHARLAPWGEIEEGPREAFWEVVMQALGDVCLGAAVAPAVGATRGLARGMRAVAGGSDEFLFSCTACCTGVAEGMVTRWNRWGFVHVGAYRKGFGQASWDVWDMFARKGMGRLVDRDITGSFCFMCGTAGGSAAALVAGSWVLALDKRLATAAAVYAFLLGYYLSRIAMAWPQACVAAYHVAYAENPYNRRLSSSLADRIRELELSPD